MSSIYSTVIGDEEAAKLLGVLQEGGYEPKAVPYAAFAFAKPGVSVAFYAKSNKLVVQGKGTEEFLEFVLEPRVTGICHRTDATVSAGTTGTRKVAVDASPHFGIDESGKGDYFGPLVIAGVYTDGAIAEKLAAAGVCDSKLVKSAAAIDRLAAKIVAVPGIAFEVVCIGPKRYNEIYAEMGNLNRLLAWGHARVIAALHEKVPLCPRALSDQFANPWVLRKALGARNVPIALQQRTKAESDVAVAAASILARERFVRWLKDAAAGGRCELPPGAGPHVVKAAKAFVRQHGADMLGQVAKLHFKTTGQVL